MEFNNVSYKCEGMSELSSKPDNYCHLRIKTTSLMSKMTLLLILHFLT